MPSIFLTPQELANLTGRKQKSAQAIELKRMKIQHWINAAGQPVVPRSAIEGRNVIAGLRALFQRVPQSCFGPA